MKRVVLLSSLVLAACGGGGSAPPDETYDLAGGTVVDMAKKLDGATPHDLAGADLTGPQPDLTVVDMTNVNPPNITLVSPLTTADVTGQDLTIQVMVSSPTMRAIASVGVTLDGGTNIPLSAIGSSGAWQGSIDLSSTKSGPHKVIISATDTIGSTGSLSETYNVDHGPNITFVSPTLATARSSVAVEIQVDDPLYGPVTASNVTATVRSTNLPLTAVADKTLPATAIELDGTITFNTYTPVLNGAQTITVIAKNSKGTMSTATKIFTVDDVGPVIVINNPVANLFASGGITVSATVTDMPSGVDPDSVFVVFGGDAADFKVQLMLDPSQPTMGTYTGFFDIGRLGMSGYVTPDVSVTASDTIGNNTVQSESILIDNTRPWMSLDPPNVRMSEVVSGVGTVCSVSFDPLGTETLNDGFNPPSDAPAQELTIRARIEDQGNTASNLTAIHISDINASTVQLVAISNMPGETPVIAVDSDGDGLCDELNPLLDPVTLGMEATSTTYVSLPMVPITLTGTVNFFSTDGQTVNGCTQVGYTSASVPPLLCTGGSPPTSLTYGLRYTTAFEPALWTLSPVDNNTSGAECVGRQFDDLNSLPEGSACFVVAATDNSGNTGISAPLRTCIRRSSAEPHVCDTWVKPNCTGTFDPTTNKVDATKPCTQQAQWKANEIHPIQQ